MTATATTTLEATLVSPTTGKERGLRRTVANYRRALRDAFDAHADTMSAVNDIVTRFELPYQAKDALKNYVPKLRNTYGASELADDHPVRFVNRAATFDHDADRDAEFVWNVPQPGRGTNFWIPLHVNPEQREVWFDLLDGDAEPGELRLIEHREQWELHITVEHEVPEPSGSDDPTYVAFDIGESKLLAGCACRDDGTPVRPIFVDGGRARHLRKEMHTTLKRLQERDAAEWRTDERFGHYQNALTDIVEKASRRAVEYAQSFDNPIIALEDLSYIRERLNYGAYMNRRLHAWAFARLQGRIEDKAREAGIRVEFVAPAYTSKTCHACGHIGRRSTQAEFRCTNSECWVTEYQADLNAASNIAGRVDPWGESLPLKPADDDSPRDGSACDSATARREPSAKPAQMTLAEWG
jgi:IS605 OrfB family transposase